MIKIGTYKYKLSRWQFDFEDKLTLIQLMNLLLESAGNHAEERGFGIDNLMAEDKSWVLLRARIEFLSDFNEKQEIQIETWVDEIKGLFTTRRLNVLDSRGEVFCAVATTWAMINIKTRKMLHLTELLDEKFLFTEKEALTKAPEKINPIDEKNEALRSVEALYSSIDINNHVTTTRYIQWILDSFSIDDLKENRIKIFEINFQNEAKFRDTLEVHKQKISDEIYIIELTKVPEIQICRARILFEKKS